LLVAFPAFTKMFSKTGNYQEKYRNRLSVFENWVLRIFGPKRDEVTGGWRKLRNGELLN
jgi:hypothetical protein